MKLIDIRNNIAFKKKKEWSSIRFHQLLDLSFCSKFVSLNCTRQI